MLPGALEAAGSLQDVVAGAAGLAEVIGAFPVLQDVRDGHGVVRGAGAVLGRIRRLIRSGDIWPDLGMRLEAGPDAHGLGLGLKTCKKSL